jgi:hypothetical protein
MVLISRCCRSDLLVAKGECRPRLQSRSYGWVVIDRGYKAAPTVWVVIDRGYKAAPTVWVVIDRGYKAAPTVWVVIDRGYRTAPTDGFNIQVL